MDRTGQVTDIPAYGYDIHVDDKMIQNASFLRMKTLTLQYDLPKKWLAPTRYIKGVKVFGIARNLFTITSFEGYDPGDINIVQFNILILASSCSVLTGILISLKL